MAGIYIHIPYCRHKCHYCNFYSVAGRRLMPEMVKAISAEIEQRRDYLQLQPVATIYFGGGTPSMLDSAGLAAIVESIRSNYTVAADAEITLEANPDDISPAYLQQIAAAGINRLSIGIQSFRQPDLEYLGRRHTAEKAIRAVKDALDAGFTNLSADLIYGIPTLTEAGWQQNLETAFGLGVPHISAYALTVESATALEVQIRKGRIAGPGEQQAVEQYHLLTRLMRQHGYEHYEISNFCLPGQYSKHNTAYWQGVHYLGAGPAAHSFNGVSRQWNVSGIEKYIQAVAENHAAEETEMLDTATRYNERVMTSLRTMWGCDLTRIKDDFGSAYAEYLLQQSANYIAAGQLEITRNRLLLTESGKLFADRIASELFMLDEA